MAYRGGAGYWVAIIVLLVLAFAFGGLYFSQQSEVEDTQKKLNTSKPEELQGEPYKNQYMAQIILKVDDQAKTIGAKEDEISKLKAEIDNLKKEYDRVELAKNGLEQQLVARDAKIESLGKEVEQERQHSKSVMDAREKTKSATEQRLNEHIQKLKGEKDLQVQKNKRLEERNEAIQTAAMDRISILQSKIFELKQAIENMTKARQMDQVAYTEEDHDGQIIQADVDNKFVVINLGSEHRIRRGMRFDVIRWRLNKWDFMGAVQVMEVSKTTSTAMILDKVEQKKICPETRWVAPDTAMRYSPWVTRGADNRAVELVKTEVEEKSSMRKMDPIVKGDYITHPFYSRNKVLKFVVVGEPVDVAMEDVKQRIVDSGGVIQDAVGIDTDYLVLGRERSESDVITGNEETRKTRDRAVQARQQAEKLGVPLLPVVRVFEFLKR